MTAPLPRPVSFQACNIDIDRSKFPPRTLSYINIYRRLSCRTACHRGTSPPQAGSTSRRHKQAPQAGSPRRSTQPTYTAVMMSPIRMAHLMAGLALLGASAVAQSQEPSKRANLSTFIPDANPTPVPTARPPSYHPALALPSYLEPTFPCIPLRFPCGRSPMSKAHAP